MRYLKLPLILMSSCALLASLWLQADTSVEKQSFPNEPQTTTPLDLSQTYGKYMGYGIGIHASDIDFVKAFDDLQPQFVRMEYGPRWDVIKEPVPEGVSVDEYYQYLVRNYNDDAPDREDGARYSHEFLTKRGIQIIKIHFELLYRWRDENGQFKSKHIEDLARFHTAHLKYLRKIGVDVEYMELCNEPDGKWNGHITGPDYGRLLKRCDTLFEQHGLGDVKILGPGLTFLNLHQNQQPYFDAIKEAGPQHLDGWSTHIWDEAEFTHSRPEYTYGIWQPFLDRIKALDPKHEKPIFVTEYASDIIQFGDKKWVSPRDRVEGTVVDTWHNAVRVIANSITNLNRGTNALVLYRLSDTHWHKTGWGMITPLEGSDFKPKPVYHALIHSLKTLPVDGTILKPSWYQHDDPVTISMLHQETDKKLHLLAANSEETTQTKEILLSDAIKGLSTDEISTMIETGVSNATKVTISDTKIIIEMPPLSIARINLQLK